MCQTSIRHSHAQTGSKLVPLSLGSDITVLCSNNFLFGFVELGVREMRNRERPETIKVQRASTVRLEQTETCRWFVQPSAGTRDYQPSGQQRSRGTLHYFKFWGALYL